MVCWTWPQHLMVLDLYLLRQHDPSLQLRFLEASFSGQAKIFLLVASTQQSFHFLALQNTAESFTGQDFPNALSFILPPLWEGQGGSQQSLPEDMEKQKCQANGSSQTAEIMFHSVYFQYNLFKTLIVFLLLI